MLWHIQATVTATNEGWTTTRGVSFAIDTEVSGNTDATIIKRQALDVLLAGNPTAEVHLTMVDGYGNVFTASANAHPYNSNPGFRS